MKKKKKRKGKKGKRNSIAFKGVVEKKKSWEFPQKTWVNENVWGITLPWRVPRLFPKTFQQ